MRAVVYDRCARVTEFAVGDRVFGMRAVAIWRLCDADIGAHGDLLGHVCGFSYGEDARRIVLRAGFP